MKHLGLHILKCYLKVAVFFYFKKVRVVGASRITTSKPLLILGNHQNALLDALLLAVTCPLYAHYLTRASVFKKTTVSKLLQQIGLMPIYRIRDGWGNLNQNTQVFEVCTQLLRKGKTVVIFPEGNHNLQRRVRPLSKGFTRLVQDTLEQYPDTDLKLLPVGFNYQKAVGFPDSVLLNFGQLIDAKPLCTDKKTVVTHLKQTVQEALQTLTVHLPETIYDEKLQELDSKQVDYLEPEAINACVDSVVQECQLKTVTPSFFAILKPLVYLLLLLPVLVWRLAIKPKIKEPEFISTFRFAVSAVLIPVWLLLLCVTVGVLVGVVYGLGLLAAVVLLMLLYVKA